MLPNFVIIGAMKAGTTGLHQYLALHPQIHMSAAKELDYFVAEMNWVRGREWYESQFDSTSPVRGEASPNYTKRHLFQGVPERMHALIPDARLVYLVRDPIARLVSHYVENHHKGEIGTSFEEACSGPTGDSLLNASRYAYQLEPFLALYGRESILVVRSEHLATRRLETLRRVFRFLGVAEDYVHPGFSRMVYETKSKVELTRLGRAMARVPGGRRIALKSRRLLPHVCARPVRAPQVRPALRAKLAAALRPDVECLRRLTGDNFDDWQI